MSTGGPGVVDFMLLGHLHRLALTDLDHDVEETLRGEGDRALIAAGLPVGRDRNRV